MRSECLPIVRCLQHDVLVCILHTFNTAIEYWVNKPYYPIPLLIYSKRV